MTMLIIRNEEDVAATTELVVVAYRGAEQPQITRIPPGQSQRFKLEGRRQSLAISEEPRG